MKEATAQTYRETPSGLQKAADDARQEKARQEAVEQLTKALGYKVPAGSGLPSEGQTYKEVLDISARLGHSS